MFINGFDNKFGTCFSLLIPTYLYKYIANNSYYNSNSNSNSKKNIITNNIGFCIQLTCLPAT